MKGQVTIYLKGEEVFLSDVVKPFGCRKGHFREKLVSFEKKYGPQKEWSDELMKEFLTPPRRRPTRKRCRVCMQTVDRLKVVFGNYVCLSCADIALSELDIHRNLCRVHPKQVARAGYY